jgi:PAS domain S-box-containing protein
VSPDHPDTVRVVGDAASYLAAIVESADDAIVSKDLNGMILSWNRAAERMFGWSAEEAVGRHITLIIPEERHPEEHDILGRIRRGEGVDHFETVRVAKDGRLLDISLSVSPVRDAHGRVVGASKIARDVTERRRLEDERNRLLREAEALNRAKDRLLATVSHELRTPLNSILGYARMLETGDLDEAAARHAVRVIVRSARTQSQIVDDLLDLSRAHTGRMTLRLEPADLVGIVEGAIDIVRPAADAKGVTLVATLEPGVGTLVCAPDRMRQVVWNLAINAIKFTPAGGRVHVTVRRVGANAEIVVADNGAGIDPALLTDVFELFRQEDDSLTREHGGLGVGLALVKSLVELHGGRVRAESPGKGMGATFTVTLPHPDDGRAAPEARP